MNLIRVSSEGDFDEVSFLLRSEDKGAAVNATFVDVQVSTHNYKVRECTEILPCIRKLLCPIFVPRSSLSRPD